jgi:hypothetical protein
VCVRKSVSCTAPTTPTLDLGLVWVRDVPPWSFDGIRTVVGDVTIVAPTDLLHEVTVFANLTAVHGKIAFVGKFSMAGGSLTFPSLVRLGGVLNQNTQLYVTFVMPELVSVNDSLVVNTSDGFHVRTV